MSGKYLKARQLAKEMEEKAEKTAEKKKNAKEMEEKAEKYLEMGKDLDIDISISEIEKKIEEGRAEIDDKNFERAGEELKEAIEELHEIYTNKLNEILEPVKNFLDLSDEIEDEDKLKEDIEEAKDLLEEGSIKDSFKKAEDIRERSESVIEEEIEKQIANVKSLLEGVERAGKKKGKVEKIVVKAEYAYDGKEYDRALSLTRDARELIGDKFRGELDQIIRKLEDRMDRLDERGIDISKSQELFEKARESKEDDEYGKAVGYVQKCRDRLDEHFTSILKEAIRDLEDGIEEAKELGAPVREVEEKVEEIEDCVDEKKIEKAGGLLDEAFEKVKELKFEEVLNTIAESREYFIKAKEIGADISEPMNLLSTARDSLQEGDYKEALDLAKKGREKVQNLVKEFDEVRQKINSKEEKVRSLEDVISIRLPEVEKILDEAEAKLQEEKYDEAMEVLEEFGEIFDKKAYEKVMEVIEEFERLIKVAEKIEIDLKDLSDRLDEAESKTKDSEFVEAAEIAKEGRDSLKRKIEDGLDERLKSIRDELKALEDIDDEEEDRLEDMLAKSRNKINSENYLQAEDLLNETEEELKRTRGDIAEKRIDEISEILSIFEEEIETEKIDTSSYRDDIEEIKDILSKSEYEEALDKTEELRKDLNEGLREEAEQIFGKAKMEVIRAKKTGVDFEDYRKNLIECKKNMKEDNYLEAIRISYETEMDAKKVRVERKEAYEKISETASEVSELKKEGKVEDISEIKDVLMEAKDQFREKDYSTAKEMTKKAQEMIDKGKERSEFKEKKGRVLEKIDKVKTSENLSAETEDIRSDIDEASDLAEKNEYSKAMEIVERVDDSLNQRLKENLDHLISETESSIESLEKLGMDIEKLDSELSEAGSLLEKGSYWDSLEILVSIEEKIEDFKELHKKADEKIEKVKTKIEDARDINAKADEAKKLLADAEAGFEEDRYEESIKRAEKAEESVERALEEQVDKIINRFKEKIDHYRSEREDMELADDFIQKAKKAKEDGNYNEAINYAMQSEGELEKIELQQKVAKNSISKSKQKLKDAKEKGLMIDRLKKALKESIKAFKSGFYVKAFDNAVNVGEELNEILECYDRSEKFLQHIDDLIDELKKEDENVDDLIEAKEEVSERFEDGDYKEAYSYLSEVEDLLEKEKVREIIERLQTDVESLPNGEEREEVEEALESALTSLDIEGPLKAVPPISKAKKELSVKKKEDYERSIEKVEHLLREAKKCGATVNEIKKKVEGSKRSEEEEKWIEASRKAEEALDMAEEVLEDYSPKIEIKAPEELRLDEWNEIQVSVKNVGHGVAQNPELEMDGGEIQDHELKDKLKAGEEIDVSCRIKPTSENAQIIGKALRIFDEKELRDEYELHLTDISEREEVCDICQEIIEEAEETISCDGCEALFHAACTTETKKCPDCGTEIASGAEEKEQKRVDMDT